jgi:hypothetical protein
MQGSLRRFIVTQRLLGFLRCENLAGFALSLHGSLGLVSLPNIHVLTMHKG